MVVRWSQFFILLSIFALESCWCRVTIRKLHPYSPSRCVRHAPVIRLIPAPQETFETLLLAPRRPRQSAVVQQVIVNQQTNQDFLRPSPGFGQGPFFPVQRPSCGRFCGNHGFGKFGGFGGFRAAARSYEAADNSGPSPSAAATIPCSTNYLLSCEATIVSAPCSPSSSTSSSSSSPSSSSDSGCAGAASSSY